MSTDPAITPNPSGCTSAPGLLHHHAARLTWPDGSRCDLMIVASALRPSAAHQWATDVDHATRERLGQAIARALGSGLDTGHARADLAARLLAANDTAGRAEQRALMAEADAATMRRERDAFSDRLATWIHRSSAAEARAEAMRQERNAALEQAALAEAECAGLRLHIQRFSLPEPEIGGGQ
jgi:hypothetical protein